MKKTPLVVLAVLLWGGGSALAANLMLDFGATAAADPYLTLSPGHSSGAIAAGQTSWNTISSATPPGSLLYSDGPSPPGSFSVWDRRAQGAITSSIFPPASPTLVLREPGEEQQDKRVFLRPVPSTGMTTQPQTPRWGGMDSSVEAQPLAREQTPERRLA